jgi:replicative DNA helicase
MSTVQRIDRSAPAPGVTSEILDKSPPSDLTAERSVLGSILLLPDVCDDVALLIRSEDFHDEANRILFQHMLEMHESGRKIDPTLLIDKLRRAGDYEKIGGAAYLAEVGRCVANAAHARYYAKIVQDKSIFRSLINVSTEILRDAYDQSHDSVEAVNRAEQRIFAVQDKRTSTEVPTLSEVLRDAMAQIDARLRGEQDLSGVETGYADLDKLTGGLHNSELTILAARPSMGKSALALNIAANVAIDAGIPTLFVSLEMSNEELVHRVLCSEARVNSHRLRAGQLSKENQSRVVDTANRISEAPLFLEDSPSRSVSEIAAAARRIRRREKRLGLIVIDYLQLVEPDNPRDPRQEQVARIARRLKGMAREMGVPVLCLAQVNRQADDTKGKNPPRLSHLRESGAIEQDADVVMFVHREEYFADGEERKEAEEAKLIIAKQRNGPTGRSDLVWKRAYTRFEDRARPRHEEFDQYDYDDTEFS